jgi:hypothetical protein
MIGNTGLGQAEHLCGFGETFQLHHFMEDNERV